MDILELRDRLVALDRDLFVAVGRELDAFRLATGVSVNRVSVEIQDVQRMGQRDQDPMLVAVRCDIDI
jgi:hypothetical protein